MTTLVTTTTPRTFTYISTVPLQVSTASTSTTNMPPRPVGCQLWVARAEWSKLTVEVEEGGAWEQHSLRNVNFSKRIYN